MKKRLLIVFCLLIGSMANVSAQDITFSQVISNAAWKSRTPEGDREYYGLWARDKVLAPPKVKTKWESSEDSIRKRGEFVGYCRIAFNAYEEKDALKTVVYGDSALMTGFDNPQIYFYMAASFEKLGDYKRAEISYREARSHNMPGGRQALAAFKQRMKERKKNGH